MAKSAAERQADRRARDPEAVRAVKQAYVSRHRERLAAEARRRRESEEGLRKIRARMAVSNAIRDGRLERGTVCEHADGDCLGRIEAHHPDYSRALDVRWLCARHHWREDRR